MLVALVGCLAVAVATYSHSLTIIIGFFFNDLISHSMEAFAGGMDALRRTMVKGVAAAGGGSEHMQLNLLISENKTLTDALKSTKRALAASRYCIVYYCIGQCYHYQ